MRQKQLKMSASCHFEFYLAAKFFMVVLCESLHFVLYNACCSYFALFSSYVNITKLLKFEMAAKRPF